MEYFCLQMHTFAVNIDFSSGWFYILYYSNGSDPAALLDVLFDVCFIICMECGWFGVKAGGIYSYLGIWRYEARCRIFGRFSFAESGQYARRFRIKQSEVSPFMSSFIPLILGYCWFYYEFSENLICFFETLKSMIRMEFGFTVSVFIAYFRFLCISYVKFLWKFKF